MTGRTDAAGACEVATGVHDPVGPSCHVSDSVETLPSPPKTSTCWRPTSYAIAWPQRAGIAVSASCTQTPSYVQVSPSEIVVRASRPPYSTTLPRPRSNTIAVPPRGVGCVGRARGAQELPFHSQVSLNHVAFELPYRANRTVRWRSAS